MNGADTRLETGWARAIAAIDGLCRWSGYIVAWGALGTVLLCFATVYPRCVMGTGSVWLLGSQIWTHVAIIVLGAGYTAMSEGLVRVDVFHADWDGRRRALSDLVMRSSRSSSRRGCGPTMSRGCTGPRSLRCRSPDGFHHPARCHVLRVRVHADGRRRDGVVLPRRHAGRPDRRAADGVPHHLRLALPPRHVRDPVHRRADRGARTSRHGRRSDLVRRDDGRASPDLVS